MNQFDSGPRALTGLQKLVPAAGAGFKPEEIMSVPLEVVEE